LVLLRLEDIDMMIVMERIYVMEMEIAVDIKETPAVEAVMKSLTNATLTAVTLSLVRTNHSIYNI
jgi:hypothetical protein